MIKYLFVLYSVVNEGIKSATEFNAKLLVL